MDINLPVIAGVISTILFGISTLPMVVKAYKTKDLRSYSLSYLLLGNAGNIFHSVYVFDMPPGPIWLLHVFYLVVTGLMLFWYLRYEWWAKRTFSLFKHNRLPIPSGNTPPKYPFQGMTLNPHSPKLEVTQITVK